jgi:hypothetical protein
MKSPQIYEYNILRKVCIDLQDQITVLSAQTGDPGLITHLKETHIKIRESALNLEHDLGMEPLKMI